jgi:hypothetical protein
VNFSKAKNRVQGVGSDRSKSDLAQISRLHKIWSDLVRQTQIIEKRTFICQLVVSRVLRALARVVGRLRRLLGALADAAEEFNVFLADIDSLVEALALVGVIPELAASTLCSKYVVLPVVLAEGVADQVGARSRRVGTGAEGILEFGGSLVDLRVGEAGVTTED